MKVKFLTEYPEQLRVLTEQLQQWDLLLEASEQESDKICIVACGKQNCGKSTLLNILCNDKLDTLFKTGDKRVTTDIQQEEFGNYIYIDTPGFGPTEKRDTEMTRQAWQKAYLVLFLHSIKEGELLKEEVMMLEELKEYLPQAEKRILFVCTKIGGEKNAKIIISKIENQVKNVLGDFATIVSIDSLFYQKYLIKSDERFKRISHIEEVTQWIVGKKLSSPQQEKINAHKKILMETMEKSQRLITKSITNCRDKRYCFIRKLKNSWIALHKIIEDNWNDCHKCVENIKKYNRDL